MLPNLSRLHFAELPRCLPCAPIGTVVDYTSAEQLRAEGATRLTMDCPDEKPDCDDADLVPQDPILFNPFRRGEKIIILGCGHAFKVRTVRSWNADRSRPTCPLEGLHEGRSYFLTIEEQQEVSGTRPTVYGSEGELLSRPSRSDSRNTDHFEGPPGQERKVRTVRSDGVIEYYEGPQGQERKVRTERPDGVIKYYEGPQGLERLVRAESLDGTAFYYEGPSGEERLVRVEALDGIGLY